ncbi:MAG: SCO family protein [Bacteroidota bacterium]
MSRLAQVFMVSIFFIGFPAVSWYYLNQGYNYRVGVIEELDQQLGNIPDFKLTNQHGKKIAKDMLKKRVVINNFLALEDASASEKYMQRIYNIQDQFDKKDDIIFNTYVQGASVEAVEKYVNSLKIKQDQRWNFLTGSEEEMNKLMQQFPLPENASKTYAGNSMVAIADTASIIRYFYDIDIDADVSQLIVHIANLMPQAPPEEARMKKELEK